MKANELRIGNMVLMNNKPYPITFDDFAKHGLELVCDSPITIHFDELKPIPLTEEWLLRFGFEEHETVKCLYSKRVGNFEIHLTIEGSDLLDIELSSTNISGAYPDKNLFKYVHQLQNLYYCLTGEELTIKNHV